MEFSKTNYLDFITYSLIYCAHSDLDFADEEKELIIQKVGRMEYNEILEFFRGHSEIQSELYLRAMAKSWLMTPEGKQSFHNKIVEITEADHRLMPLEKSAIKLLDEIMEK